jgi:hypothetical protein
MESTATIKNQELLNACIKATERLKEKMTPFNSKFIELQKLKKVCSENEISLDEYLSLRDRENLYKYVWLEVSLNYAPSHVVEFISLLEYTPSPEVMEIIFAKRHINFGISCALVYLYSELINKVFPISADLAAYLTNKVELITWNGVAIPLKSSVYKLIGDSPKIYLVGSKDIEELVSFMTFIPVQ